MAVHESVSVYDFIPPVCSFPASGVFLHKVQDLFYILGGGKRWNPVLIGIVRSQILIFDILFGIQHVRPFPRILPCRITVIGNLEPVIVIPLFGGHDDDTV